MRIMYVLKKVFVILLIGMLIPITSIESFAALINIENKIHYVNLGVPLEKKYFCNATLDDNFLEDSIIVLMRKNINLDSSKLKDTYFSEINMKSIRSLTEGTDTLVRNIREITNNNISPSSVSDAQKNKLQTLSSTTGYNIADIEKMGEDFNQIIEIELQNPGKQNVLNAIKELEKRNDVIAVEPNYVYSFNANQGTSSGDILEDVSRGDFSQQWAIDKIELDKAWEIADNGSTVYVGVLDTGIYAEHMDLEGNIDTELGYDFIGESNTLTDPYIGPGLIGHGTYVAGIIGAKGGENSYIAGACKKVKLVNLRVLNEKGLTTLGTYINAIEYAHEHNIPIINLSAHAEEKDFVCGSKTLIGAIQNYFGLFVCAAGNYDGVSSEMIKDNDTYPSYPSSYTFNKDYDGDGKLDGDNIIAVAATNIKDMLWEDSHYGSQSVDLGAPGEDILSTTSDGHIDVASGTSFAAPYVSGVAALLKSKYPWLTTVELKEIILNSVDKVEALKGKCVSGGRLNAYKAIQYAQRCTIKYNANGGSGEMDDSVIVYDAPTQTRLNEFTREGYDFDCWFAQRESDGKWRYQNSDQSQHGWYEAGSQPTGWTKFRYENGITVSRTSTVPGDTITFHAQWKKYFTIKYDSNGGVSYMEDTKVYYDVPTQTSENTFVAYGNEFDCWFAKRASDNKWRYQNPDNSSQTGWYLAGSQPTGWTKFRYENGITVSRTSTVPGDTITFYAQWKKYYTVVYKANGGTGSMENSRFYCGTQNRLPQNAYTRSGYDFDCWYAERYSDHKWKYGDNSGQSAWYIMGEQPSWWDMYRYEDHKFIAEADVSNNEIIYLNAQWKKYFTIRYHAEGGLGEMADTKVYYGVSTQLRPLNYTRAGYTFDCWHVYRESDNKWRYRNPNNTSQSGFYVEGKQPEGWVKYRYVDAGYLSATSSVAGDTVHLYAQWKKHFFIEYDGNGGYGSMPRTKVIYGVETYLSPNTFTRDGHEFLYWYAQRGSDNTWRYRSPDEESSGWYLEGQQPEGWTKYPYYDAGWVARTASNPGEVVTLYAQWKLNYCIRYDANGGEGTMADTVGYIVAGENGIIQLPECTFTRAGYDFGGWYVYNAVYDVWAYTDDGNYIEWFFEGEEPEGYYKDIIGDQSDYNVSNDEPITHVLYAVWLEK